MWLETTQTLSLDPINYNKKWKLKEKGMNTNLNLVEDGEALNGLVVIGDETDHPVRILS